MHIQTVIFFSSLDGKLDASVAKWSDQSWDEVIAKISIQLKQYASTLTDKDLADVMADVTDAKDL